MPSFEEPVPFDLFPIGFAYGIDSVDFLDASGQPGQDGLPEIAVAGSGTHVFHECDIGPGQHAIVVLRNTGSMAWSSWAAWASMEATRRTAGPSRQA